MTQLSLFDTQSTSLPIHIPALPPKEDRDEQASEGIPLFDPTLGEIQRLGDLARLVLARYDLVAQRRRNLAERQAERLRQPDFLLTQ